MFEGIILSIGMSIHAGFVDTYNNVHPHVRYQNEWLISGVYLNSVDEMSYYGGFRNEYGDWGTEFVLTTGYNLDIAPAARVTYDVTDNTRVFLNPAAEGERVGMVLGIELMY